MLRPCRTERPVAAAQVRSVRASPRHEQDADDGPRADPDRTDHRPEPPDATSVVTGPSLASDVTGGRPWTRLDDPSCGHRARARADVQRRDRGRTSGAACLGRRRDDDPGPYLRRTDRLRPHPRGLGHPPHQVRRRRRAQRQGPDLRRDQRHDRGRRRHRPHLVHDPRGARRRARTTCPASTSASASGSTPPRTACRSSSASSRAARPRRPASLVGDEIVAVDGKPTDRQHDRRDRRLGPRRSRLDGQGHGPDAAPQARDRDVSMVRADVAVAPVSWTLVPGTKTALIRLDQFSHGRRGRPQGGPRRGREGRRRPDRARPSRQPGRLRQRGRRRRQPVPQERHRLHRARRRRPRDDASRSRPAALATDLPLVVLVDGGTASSAEIVSGAIQDAGRAQIVGIKTYGTGTVLGEFPLSDGSALRVGTVEWLTPEGRRIWHEGHHPGRGRRARRATSRRSTPTTSAR